MAVGTAAPACGRAPDVLACCAYTCRTRSTALDCRGLGHLTDPTTQHQLHSRAFAGFGYESSLWNVEQTSVSRASSRRQTESAGRDYKWVNGACGGDTACRVHCARAYVEVVNARRPPDGMYLWSITMLTWIPIMICLIVIDGRQPSSCRHKGTCARMHSPSKAG